jgi:hypothetical protein
VKLQFVESHEQAKPDEEDLKKDCGYERPCQAGMEVPQGSDHGSSGNKPLGLGHAIIRGGDNQDRNDG